jgi:hypothetical protein
VQSVTIDLRYMAYERVQKLLSRDFQIMQKKLDIDKDGNPWLEEQQISGSHRRKLKADSQEAN